MNRYPITTPVRLRRWFFLGWLVIVYLWSTLGVIIKGWVPIFPKSGLGERFCGVASQNTERCISIAQLTRVAEAKLPTLGALTLFLIGFGLLLWMNLSKTDHLRFYRLSFPMQGILILMMTVLVSEVEMALILALILALEIIFLFKQASLVFGVSCSAILLFIFIITMTSPQESTSWFPIIWNSFGPITAQSFMRLLVLLLFVVGYLVVYMQWLRAHAQLEAAHRELEETHKDLVTASSHIAALTRLTERQRLARDLHDTLAQGLAGLIMQLQIVGSYQVEQRYDQAQAIIEQAILRARSTLAEARQTIEKLRHISLDAHELKQIINEEVDHFTSATSIPCESELSALSVLPPALNEHILYMIKEGLSNIARHAHAHAARIDVTTGEQSIQVEIRDDGIGFDLVTEGQAREHYGLLGLRERVTLCGGQFEIVSKPGGGTRLKLCFPLIGEEVFRDEENPCHHCG